MMPKLVSAARGMLVLILTLLCMAPAGARTPIIGTWSTTVDWDNRQAGLAITLSIGTGGRIRERVMNHDGMSYDLMGRYRMDAAGATMHFTWVDYSPKQICVGGNCTPMGPPQPLGLPHTSHIRFRGPNFFIGTTEDGVSLPWVKQSTHP